MVIKVVNTGEEIGEVAALLFAAQVLKKPDAVLGFATGSSPITTYQHMIKLYNQGVLDFSRVTSFNLDEYVGLPGTHEQSYRYFMTDNLFSHINIPAENIHLPNGIAADADAECKQYEAAVRAAGVDLQILGIGHNGHIGFNEPGDAFVDGTHKVTLTETTIQANTRFFASSADVPRYALTMGAGTIMRAKSVVLVANGEDKAQAIWAMAKGPISPSCQASILQLHPDVTVVVDKSAASKL
ncbi:MAG: glucosamine-6-phosphate deaminase [Oscillospiraceae bacterium]|nr:glucosamine-6-phosphate deaminase [Oscillospiraceae bacterium]